ncbi:MAG: diguanylate cyclase [Candidatus Omnitrophica bacterium]|nr:diguanylate cyclase [Candidatus Omnitrophota bacterium]
MAYKILVAEKDSASLALLETRLKARGYDVFLATHSDEAIRLVQKVRFDLVLIASAMEPVDGVDLAQKIKQTMKGLGVSIILIADENEISELVLSREHGFDDFLIKPFDAFSLQLRMMLNLTRARERLEANPLTSLPGSIAIEENIQRRLDRNEVFSVCYIDINHFKSFNDRYGFNRGDSVIRHLAQLISKSLETTGAKQTSFIGHIGGDDFVVITTPELEASFAQECLQEFDRIIPTYYEEADRKQKSVFVKNRNGVPMAFPLMSLSIAAITNLHLPYRNVAEISSDAAEVKQYLKTQPGSHYLRDRRAKPVSSLEESMEILSQNQDKRKTTTKPLGQMLLEMGLITEEELNHAVRRHIETGERIGQVLIRMNVVTSADVGRFLEEKLNVSYVSLRGHALSEDLARILTEEFIRAHRVVPLALGDSFLELAMVDPVNHDTIALVEEISGLKVVPKFALENEFEEFLEKNHQWLS